MNCTTCARQQSDADEAKMAFRFSSNITITRAIFARIRYPAQQEEQMMIRTLYCVVLFFGVTFASSLLAQESDSSTDLEKVVKVHPFIGTWKVISQTSGVSIMALPDNEISLLDDLLAEYDRTHPSRVDIALYNTKWSGEGNSFSTRLYRSPSNSLNIPKYSEKNVAAHAYLQCRGDSAILVISEYELDGDPFQLTEPIIMLDAFARVLTLYRINKESKNRNVHIENLMEYVRGIDSNLADIKNDPYFGGFLEENVQNQPAKQIK